MLDTDGNFYLGNIYNTESKEITDKKLLYDPDDLTTHAVVVGMTGSGKTGLCIDLLEEAALNNIPALMIDPKGDITNALLHFPDLLPADFQPWVNPDEARREGKTIEQAAEDAADLWRSGLADWGIGSDRLQTLKESAHFAIYTPGSDVGIPVSILANLKAPDIPWSQNREILREEISGTVTAILGLVGMTDIDPVRSREHILLSNIFEDAWSQGIDLDLGELILKTQNPPFSKLGVFDVDTFFPEKDRFDLAMLLNNILASPSFQTWIEGQPLEIGDLLYHPDGRPRHSVFYIAHLSDAERMFFVTLLYSAIDSWMRTQKGTTSLRAIVYFDEIYGYLPPVKNPPSKTLMLRMLKMARAFGIGQVLVTQNPVDVDYKALSNAGSWFIGKLQTERDKERLLEGLQNADPSLDRPNYDDLISALGKRVFLMHNVHEKKPHIFHTRWAMNYLAGPLTRIQIPQVNALAGITSQEYLKTASGAAAAGTSVAAEIPADQSGSEEITPQTYKPLGDADRSTTRPKVPSNVNEYFLPHNLTLSQAAKVDGRELSPSAKQLGIVYNPVLLAQAQVRFLQRKYDLDHEEVVTALVIEPDRRGAVRWEDWLGPSINPRKLDRVPVSEAMFSTLENPLNDDSLIRSMESDFKDWIYRTVDVKVRANEELDIFVGPDVPQSDFRSKAADAAREERDKELLEVKDSYKSKFERIEDYLIKEERELREDEEEFRQRKMEEMGTHVENVASLLGLGSRRRMSTSLSKRRMTQKAKLDVEESEDKIEEYKEELKEMEEELKEELEKVNQKWSDISDDMTEIPIHPYKKDILIDLFGVAWMPYHLVESGNQEIELPGFSPES